MKGVRRRRLAIAAAVGILIVVCFAACGESPQSEAKRQRIEDPVRPGSVSARVGSLRLLHIRIQKPAEGTHPADDNANLFLTLVNDGAEADSLIAVASVDAQRVVQRRGDAPVADRIRVGIPAGGSRNLQHPDVLHLEMVGLKRDIGAGQFVPVTFRFTRAGAVSANVFVQVTDHPTVPSPSLTPTE